MSEFVFRNLSVKVFPVRADQACSDRTVTLVECTPCTHLCTGSFRVCDDGCTHADSVPITKTEFCNGPGTSPGFVDTTTNIILPADDVVTELATLKASLRVAMSAVEVAEQRAQSDEGLSPVEGIDRVRQELMSAVDQLDEYRQQLE